ncbi:MAG TPA: mercury(II) reductase [Candidatus Binatia bacterium]|nr:mercury(II) reductase [Candidatus Binatia bacterium]
MASNEPDLLVVGSGSTAFAAAIAAHDLGARVVMVERRTLGGTCANRGCLPSKNLIEAARIVHEAAHPRYEGLAPARIEIDAGRLLAQKDAVVHAYRAKKYASVADALDGVEVVTGEARFVDPATVAVGEAIFRPGQVLVASGSRPEIPPIRGLAEVPFLTSDLLDADEDGRLVDIPPSLVVLGGGYIAAELAQLFARLGSSVSIIARSRLLSDFEPELGTALAAAFRAEGIEVIEGARIERVQRDGDAVAVAVETAAGGRIVRGERLLVATGRRPNTDGLGLEAAGVATDGDGFVIVDPELRTSQPHIWAAGDVIGRQHGSQMATPVGARQGRIVAENAFAGAGRRFDGTVIPRAVFTDPPIGTVGLTEAEVRARRLPAVVAATPLEHVPRAGAIHRTEGLVKFVASTLDERVLGVHMIGEAAAEVIHEAAMALRFRATLTDFVDLIHVYPTMAEALKIGAQAFSRDVSKLSCCAE